MLLFTFLTVGAREELLKAVGMQIDPVLSKNFLEKLHATFVKFYVAYPFVCKVRFI